MSFPSTDLFLTRGSTSCRKTRYLFTSPLHASTLSQDANSGSSYLIMHTVVRGLLRERERGNTTSLLGFEVWVVQILSQGVFATNPYQAMACSFRTAPLVCISLTILASATFNS